MCCSFFFILVHKLPQSLVDQFKDLISDLISEDLGFIITLRAFQLCLPRQPRLASKGLEINLQTKKMHFQFLKKKKKKTQITSYLIDVFQQFAFKLYPTVGLLTSFQRNLLNSQIMACLLLKIVVYVPKQKQKNAFSFFSEDF